MRMQPTKARARDHERPLRAGRDLPRFPDANSVGHLQRLPAGVDRQVRVDVKRRSLTYVARNVMDRGRGVAAGLLRAWAARRDNQDER